MVFSGPFWSPTAFAGQNTHFLDLAAHFSPTLFSLGLHSSTRVRWYLSGDEAESIKTHGSRSSRSWFMTHSASHGFLVIEIV